MLGVASAAEVRSSMGRSITRRYGCAHPPTIGELPRSLRLSPMRYFVERTPGEGVRPARAFLRSDAPTLSLNGEWAFRYAERADGPADFVDRDYDDGGWDRL